MERVRAGWVSAAHPGRRKTHHWIIAVVTYVPEPYLRSWEVAKDSVNCAQNCPFGAESPAPRPRPCPLPPSSLHPGHARAEVLPEPTAAPRQPLGPSTLSRGGRPLPGGQPWLSAGTATCPLAPAHAVSITPARALAGVCGVAGPPLLRLAACCSAVPCGSPRAWVTGQFLTLCLSQGIRAEAHDL